MRNSKVKKKHIFLLGVVLFVAVTLLGSLSNDDDDVEDDAW